MPIAVSTTNQEVEQAAALRVLAARAEVERAEEYRLESLAAYGAAINEAVAAFRADPARRTAMGREGRVDFYFSAGRDGVRAFRVAAAGIAGEVIP